ncbi:hypothetical protein [Bradyrhizobium sp. WSM1743]|uniref:hypothetical protein n=1 Tax=Bradyrhizobium sp. WSM1743 TaxID=318996 RepID=UPI0004227DAC|nr:hypothetical protein [Bradyrhizobium sp. WSM1743]
MLAVIDDLHPKVTVSASMDDLAEEIPRPFDPGRAQDASSTMHLWKRRKPNCFES